MTYGGGPWTAPGQKNGNSNAIWWILGAICAAGLIIAVVGALALATVLGQSMNSGTGPNLVPTSSSSSFTPAARPSSPAAPAAPSVRESPRFPQVQPAAELPRDDAAALGVEVDIQTSELRYAVLDMFDETIYNCIFSADFQNLTDRPVEVTMAFRTTGDPRMEWAGGAPKKLDPNGSATLALGWDGLTPDDVGLSEEECTGGVELTELVVASG